MVLETADSGVPELKEGMVIKLTTFRAARDTRLHVSVWGMPYSEQFCFRPEPAPRPLIAGTLTARVESDEKNAPYAHLDKTGRYRVKLDFSREDAEQGYNYLWIRQAKPYAGETYGWHTPLTDGTEVGIAFDGGDPDRPYIAHAFHNSEHPDVVTRDNCSQNILRTAGQNELRMEDLRQSEHIALSTPFGTTALNQGHIVDAENEPRGTGFELRTDEYGVIRVAKGLLVTADGKVHGEGDVLDRDVALREIEAVRTQIEGLATATRQAKALEADIASQQAMFSTRLKTLNEMLHFSAPEGMTFTSAEHLQLAAGKNIALNAGGDISIGTQGHITGLAGDSVGMFAQHGKLSLISAHGPVQFQAQNGMMHLSAEQKLTLISASEILLAGKKRIRLVGGGSSILIEQGQIKYETAGTYTRKASRLDTEGGASQAVKLPYLPGKGEYDLALNFFDGLDAIPKAPYIPETEQHRSADIQRRVLFSQSKKQNQVNAKATTVFLKKAWRPFVAGMGTMLVTGSLIAGSLYWFHRADPLKAQLAASLAPLPTALTPEQREALQHRKMSPQDLIAQTEKQLARLDQLPPDWNIRYGQQLAEQAQKLWPAQAEPLIQQWQRQLSAAALPTAQLNGWHQGMSSLQKLSDRLNGLDEQKGKYMTISELKSAVFSTMQAFNQSLPAEEQLRVLAQTPAGGPLPAAASARLEMHLKQLTARYAEIRQRAAK